MIQKLIQQVYEKINKEYKEFIDELKQTPPENIIKNAYKIAIMEEYLDMFYGNESYDRHQLRALLEKENSLDYLYKDWMDADNGIHHVIEENLDDCLIELGDKYVERLNEKIENSPNYELIKNISDALIDFNNYNFCENIKKRFEVDDFDTIDVAEIFDTKGGKEYLYHHFAQLVDDNHLQYLNEISVVNSENYNNIEEKILPKLKEIIQKEKIKQNKERDER